MKEPTPEDLETLERLADRRAEVEAARAADRRQAAVRRLQLATLDEMEEALCLHGHRSRAVRAGWRRLVGLGPIAHPTHDGGRRDGSVHPT